MPDAFPDRGQIRFRAHRDVGDVINATFAFLKENAREVVIGYLAIVGPVYLAVAILQSLYLERIQAFGADPEEVLARMADLVGPLVWLTVAGFAAGLIAQATAAAFVLLYRQGEAGTITPGRLWDETRSHIGAMAGLTGLGFVAGIGLVLLALIPCLGLLAGATFLVWAFPIFFVMLPARVLEVDSAWAAWGRARQLVKGSWGTAFGAMFIAVILMIVFSLILAIPSALVGLVAGINGAETLATEGPGLGLSLAMAPLQVLSSLIYLVPILVGFFLHGRLTEEVDGTSLHRDLDVLAGDAPLEDLIASSPAPGRPATSPPSASPPPADFDDVLGPLPDPPDPPDADGRPNDASDDPPSGFRGGGWS